MELELELESHAHPVEMEMEMEMEKSILAIALIEHSMNNLSFAFPESIRCVKFISKTQDIGKTQV